MFYEYAVEPELISNWDRAQRFLHSFGPSRGRFLARYPKHWVKLVIANLDSHDVQGVTRSSIVAKLSGLNERIYSRRKHAQFNGDLPWLSNALTEHQRRPFRAIVSATTAGENVIDGSTMDEECPLWRVQPGQIVKRDAVAYADCLELLVRFSRRILVIDPYFVADRHEKVRPLVEICKRLSGDWPSIEVISSDDARGYEHCMHLAGRVLPNALPPGCSVTLRCLRTRHAGDRLHNRYVLTDIGGVQFGDSIEHTQDGQQDHVAILGDDAHASLWKDYTGGAFEEAGPAREFVGGKHKLP
jgi:hypothetical protein